MKKIFTYFAALTALFAVSCNRIELNDGNQAGRFTISLSAGDLETRADENQTTAEKTIDHFDYFFFSDAEGTDLLQSGRETGTTKTFDTTSDEYKDLAGKSYLYVIANYPTAIPEGTETLEQLLALPVGVSITEHPEAPFVMDSYDADNDNVLIELVPTKADEVRNQVVMMRRIAAKFVVNVTVAEYAQAALLAVVVGIEFEDNSLLNLTNGCRTGRSSPLHREHEVVLADIHIIERFLLHAGRKQCGNKDRQCKVNLFHNCQSLKVRIQSTTVRHRHPR